MVKRPELPDDIEGVPIRKPGSVYLPKQLAPVPGDEPLEVKILVKVLSHKDDLERCVAEAVVLGGTSYFGLYKGDPVFKSEIEPMEFFRLLLEARIGLRGLMLIESYAGGFQNVRAIIPEWVTCSKCRGKVPYRSSFSRVEDPICDECLQKEFELPAGEE